MDSLAENVLNYSNFLYYTTPNGELLQQLLQNATDMPLPSNAKLYQRLGNTMRMQDNYEGARSALVEARGELEFVGDRLGTAQCMQSVGNIMRVQDDYEGA